MSEWRMTHMDNRTVQYCFPNNNLSCTKSIRAEVEYVLVYAFVSATSVLTVFLNLLVIISISHFKQLHTPTNVLILSLAVADLLTGLILMPVQGMKLIEPCWYFGEVFCPIFPLILYVIVTASLGNMVIITVDRYIAVKDPLRYPLKVTTKLVIISIVVNWLFSFFYSFYLLYENVLNPERTHSCLGECVLSLRMENLILDSFVCLVTPCCLIIFLYVRIFIIASKQAKQLNSATDKQAKSEKKAARTLGIVVMVYLTFWMPYYITTLSLGSDENDALVIDVMYWIVCMNSCMNPLIYAMFYRWFRLSVKCILTLKILEPSSQYFNLFPEE